jgi:hypothetical protein
MRTKPEDPHGVSELSRCVVGGGKHSQLIKKELIVAQYETPQIGDRIAPSSTEEFSSEKTYFSNRNPLFIADSLWWWWTKWW